MRVVASAVKEDASRQEQQWAAALDGVIAKGIAEADFEMQLAAKWMKLLHPRLRENTIKSLVVTSDIQSRFLAIRSRPLIKWRGAEQWQRAANGRGADSNHLAETEGRTDHGAYGISGGQGDFRIGSKVISGRRSCHPKRGCRGHCSRS